MHDIKNAHPFRAVLLFQVIYFVIVLWCIGQDAQTNTFISDPELNPPEQSYIQLKINRQRTDEIQDTYRKRLPIPEAVSDEVREEYIANAARETDEMRSEPTVVSAELLQKIILYGGLALLIGLLAFRQFIPAKEWKRDSVQGAKQSAKVRAEQEVFEKFLTAFNSGPVPPSQFLTGDSTTGEGKTTFIKRTVNEFPEKALILLGVQRRLFQEVDRATSDSSRQRKMRELCVAMGTLKEAANFSEVLLVWQLASALEGLLRQLSEKSANVTSSTLRTVRCGIELLEDLCRIGTKPDLLTDRPLRFLAVDDDHVSRQAITLALKNAFNQPDLAVDGETALELVAEHVYDVIFLDVKLPETDGFELCVKIHQTMTNRATPVVFVAGQSDFNACAQSVISGGSDLLGKPYLTFEITVKALTLALRARMNQGAPSKTSALVRQVQRRESKQTEDTEFVETVGKLHLAEPSLKGEIPVFAQPSIELGQMDKSIAPFLNRASVRLVEVKSICDRMLITSDDCARVKLLSETFLGVHQLVTTADAERRHPIIQLSIALEGLLKKNLTDPKSCTVSALTTIVGAVDLLVELCEEDRGPSIAEDLQIHILVVDDDLFARRAITGALQLTFGKPDDVESGEAALEQAANEPFDVIFMDVQMPGMDGFTTCEMIRATSLNQNTPIVLVSGRWDADLRGKMVRCGGSDYIQKPVVTAEITVKTLTSVIRARLRGKSLESCVAVGQESCVGETSC